jgi:anti-sigma regulatory factor (Ser/Thr protein kinase)
VTQDAERISDLGGTWRVDSSDVASVMAAKASVMAFLRARGASECAYDDCALAIAELLGNAVRHAERGPIEVCLDWADERPRFAVTNAGAIFAVSLDRAPLDREHGRGLFIVAQVAEPPQVAGGDGSCTVSVSLPVVKAEPG